MTFLVVIIWVIVGIKWLFELVDGTFLKTDEQKRQIHGSPAYKANQDRWKAKQEVWNKQYNAKYAFLRTHKLKDWIIAPKN